MIRRIAVLGAGTMGHGIAHAAIAAGYDTRLYDVSADAIDSGRASIETIVGRGVGSLRALRWSKSETYPLGPERDRGDQRAGQAADSHRISCEFVDDRFADQIEELRL